MNRWYMLLYLCGVLLASCGHLLLKCSANRTYASLLREYLNLPVIGGYGLMAVSSLLTVLAYREIPLSLAPVLSSANYLFVGLFSVLLFRERLTRKKLCGYGLILLGILLASA